MHELGFSIKALLLTVALAALGIFALVHATPFWAGTVVSVTTLVLLTALLALACRPSARRAFWLGFAIFGWGYLLVAEVCLEKDIALPTRALVQQLHESVSREVQLRGGDVPPRGASTRTLMSRVDPTTIDRFVTLPSEECFDEIGECLWAWLLAIVGGFVSRHFYFAQQRDYQETNARQE